MISNNLIKQWKKDETALFKGWDFSYLKERYSKEQPPWDYSALAQNFIQKSKSVLDMGTGGGEIFSSFAPFPGQAIAIEGYKPNIEVARKRLKPFGIKVLEVNESHDLPFANEQFDLVLNSHSAFKSLEVFRILSTGGNFLTQQVGGGNLDDLISAFDAAPQYRRWTLKNIEKEIKEVGFTIRQIKEWKGKVEFKDVGAIVYFLKAIPWVVQGFSVDNNLQHLERLQGELDNGKKLIFTQVRFLIITQK